MGTMKSLDYIGTAAAMVAYLLITSGSTALVFIGLHIGTVASVMLLVVANRAKLRGLTGLQVFFIVANTVALIRIYAGA